MAIFSDLELEGILNEAEDERKYKDKVKDNIQDIKDTAKKAKDNAKNNSWIGKKMSSKNESGMQTITFKEDADGNVLESSLDKGTKKYEKIDPEKITRDITNTTAVKIEKEKQDWSNEPGAKTGEMLGNIATGGNFLNDVGKKAGRSIGSKVDDFIHKKNRERRKLKEDSEVIYRSPEYNRVIDEFFDFTDRETRKVLLAVNEADQNKILVSLTSKLYDNVVDKVDDIDFGEIEMSKGDIEKLPNFETLHECLNNMARLLIEFKQDTHPVDQIAECISNMIETKDMWKKAYALNVELPMITYNTIVLAIIEATSYMVSMCVEFVKSPSEDTMKIMIDKSALTKSKSHMILKNIESFNSAFRKGQVQKAMWHVIDESSKKKNFVGLGIYTGLGVGAAVVGIAGLLFCIIPLIRELIFLFYYTRVRVSDFFEVQADLLQVSSYNVENNRLDLTKEERKKIAAKQMKTADKFRNASRFIAIKTAEAENKAVKEIKKEDNKKYKVGDVVDELPDSAASSSALF